MKQVYCTKCDLWYWTPKSDKGLEDCPFCSLEVAADNLSVKDKKLIKESQVKK
ncbi:hypothetical protein MWH25_01525 [Natroniella acetigena]|uniref:hypothetical protein n=1 Tax=Natroniella acetigena TaxID=52004 RepID=UPI00200AA768|nr:hypothetical protein [Natroniella acetigena]MCK8826428.1 hypothetical protein [Natroniella acetigena]